MAKSAMVAFKGKGTDLLAQLKAEIRVQVKRTPIIKLSDKELEMLADHFIENDIGKKMLITFDRFIQLYKQGRWYERVM